MATYYYLKLPEDFFDKHYIKIIKKLPDGNEFLIFLLKLYVESVPHAATLRFSDDLPYTNQMLANITDTDPAIVDKAMDFFKSMKIIEIMDDGTIWLPMADKLIGKETDAAKRMRERRESIKNAERSQDVQQCSEMFENVQECYAISDIDIDIDKDIEVDKPKKEDDFKTLPETFDTDLVLSSWNAQKSTKNISTLKPLTKRYDATRLCIGDDFDKFISTINSIDEQYFLSERKNITYDWFVDINNYLKVTEGNYAEKFKAKNKFNNFDQRSYDFDTMEDILFNG